jgi:hypothetical protein
MNNQELLSDSFERVIPAIAGPKPSPAGKGDKQRSRYLQSLKRLPNDRATPIKPMTEPKRGWNGPKIRATTAAGSELDNESSQLFGMRLQARSSQVRSRGLCRSAISSVVSSTKIVAFLGKSLLTKPYSAEKVMIPARLKTFRHIASCSTPDIDTQHTNDSTGPNLSANRPKPTCISLQLHFP